MAIARAILKNPAVLILDEATSNLDTESERLIEDAMAKLLVGRTTLIIAHRLSTVRRADRLVVLDHGRIVEEGSHADLLELEGCMPASTGDSFASPSSHWSRPWATPTDKKIPASTSRGFFWLIPGAAMASRLP